MNLVKIYSVYDVKSELFSTPHFVQSDGVAIRSFSTACEDESTQFNKYPSDFSLFHIGVYNIETGEIESTTPRQICNASEFVTPRRASNDDISQFAKKEIEVLETIQ
jgi:hypothetical protein